MNVEHSLQRTQLFTHALSHSFSQTYQGAQCRISSKTKKCKLNHFVKLAISQENYPWEANTAFPPLCPLGYGGDGVGQQRLLVGVSLGGIPVSQGLRDAPAGGRIFSGPYPLDSLKESLPKYFFWGREQGLTKMWPSTWSLGSQRGADQWSGICGGQPGKGDILTSALLPTPSQCYKQDSLGLPKPWPTRFLIPDPQLVYLLSIWNTQAPLCRQRWQSDISKLKKHFILVVNFEMKYWTRTGEFIHCISSPISQN